MKIELKEEVMDAVGELPDFGNLLLRESGYPHLKDTSAWNDAGTKPDHPCLCETRNISDGVIHDSIDPDDWFKVYQYWNGEYFGLSSGTKNHASRIDRATVKDECNQDVQWREVQP
jgi:hypothetical protein